MAILLREPPPVLQTDGFRLQTARGNEDAQSRIRSSVAAAQCYLQKYAGSHKSVTCSNVVIEENFAQCLLLELTKDRTLSNISQSPDQRLYNFFKGAGQLTTANYPCDVDTTAVALTILDVPDRTMLNSVLDEILEYRNTEGIIQVYFDKERTRVDPVVCLNTLTLFYKHGRGAELSRTEAYVFRVLVNKEYLKGMRYYYSAEAFLYFATRFVQNSNSSEIQKNWIPILRVHLMELRLLSLSSPDPLATAIRVCLSSDLGLLPDPKDLLSLLEGQNEEGGWRGGWFYRYGQTGVRIENAGLTSALAIKALSTLLYDV